jgi:hypothetical protein
MTRLRAAIAAALAALVLAGTAHAEAPPSPLLAPLDVNKAQSWGEALAACDMTRFLLSDPGRDGQHHHRARRRRAADPLSAALYPDGPVLCPVPGRGVRDVAGARRGRSQERGRRPLRFASTIVPKFRKGDTVEKAFLTDQMKLCNVLTDGVAAQRLANKTSAGKTK